VRDLLLMAQQRDPAKKPLVAEPAQTEEKTKHG